MSAALLIGAFGAVTAGGSDVSAAPAAVVLDEGEIDFEPRIVDGQLQLQIEDRTADSGPVWREPSQVVLHAKPETEHFVDGPMIDPVEMFDAVPGDPAWLLNGVESQLRFDLDPGWTTAHLPGAAAGAAAVSLKKVDGPGQFAMFDWDYANGENAVPYLVQRLPEYHSFTLPRTAEGADRFTPMWGFLAEGVHRITFEVTTTVGGERVTDTETVAVAVGDVDPGQVVPGDGSTPTGSPTPSSTATPSAPDVTVIDEGHVDLAARMAGGRLRFQLKEGSSADFTVHEPDEAVLHVKPRAKRRLGEGLEFIGRPDDTVWVLPQTQTNGLLWLGFGSTELNAAEVTELAYELSALRGPGHVAVFEGSALGGVTTHFNSADGLPDRYPYGANRHTHATWVFTEEGVYRVTLTVRATLASGEKVSDTGTVAVAVGEVDPSTVVPGEGGSGEPTATPTATATPTGSGSPTGTTAPAPTDTGTPTATATDTSPPGASPSDSASAPAAGSVSGGAGGTSTSGGLASTGAGVTLPLAAAAAAVAVGSTAVVAVRRRHTSGVTGAS